MAKELKYLKQTTVLKIGNILECRSLRAGAVGHNHWIFCRWAEYDGIAAGRPSNWMPTASPQGLVEQRHFTGPVDRDIDFPVSQEGLGLG